MSWLVTSPEDMAVLDELNRGPSDRAVGIIAASLVEIHLTKLIKEVFIKEVKTNSNETILEKVFHTSGPLGTFSTKIRVAYLMGLISEELLNDLENMKFIRNKFAHHTEIGSFDVQQITQKCRNFTIVDKYVIDSKAGLHGDPSAHFGLEHPGAAEKLKNPKDRYILSAQVFSIGLQHATPNAKPYQPLF